MIGPLAKPLDWSVLQMAYAVVGVRSVSKPKWKLEEALEFLNGPDFFPAASDPAQIEFDGPRHFKFSTPRPSEFRVWRTGERLLPDRAARQREGFWARNLDRLLSLLLAVVVLLWLQGNSLRSLAFPAPDWLRLTGFGLGITSVGLFAWTHVTLGRFWFPFFALRFDKLSSQ